ncbi:MAG: hypothetical protein Q7S53_00075 [bacterium]|nr:hypothetical protein [bacterium]
MNEFSRHEGYGELITDETKNIARAWVQRRIDELSQTDDHQDDLKYFKHALTDLDSDEITIHPDMIFSWADAEQKLRDAEAPETEA